MNGKEILRKTSSVLTFMIEKLWMISHKRISINNSILIVGAPRSGTTWLMEIIEKLGNYKIVFEPFHLEYYLEVRNIIREFSPHIVPYRPYLYREYENNVLRNFLYNVFTGKIAGFWNVPLSRQLKNLKWFRSNKVVVKDVWITRLLPWIRCRFKLKAYFIIIRHPCAVIESQLRTCIGNPLCKYSKEIVKSLVLKQFRKIEELKDKEHIFKRIKEINNSEEILATIWAMDYYIPLYYNKYRWWHIIVYEDLVLRPSRNINKILKIINSLYYNNNLRISSILLNFSPTSHDRMVKNIHQLIKWKCRLRKEKITRILNVINWFDLSFYNDSILPNLKALRNWKP